MSLQVPSVKSKTSISTKTKILGMIGGLLKKPSILNPDDIDSVINGDYDEAQDLEDAIPEHSLKIYKADQTHRFLQVLSVLEVSIDHRVDVVRVEYNGGLPQN